MAGPFDTTTKYLVQRYPHDWLALVGLHSGGPLELLDADLATVNPLADKVIRVSEPTARLVHLEFQSTYDPLMGQRLAEYHLLLHGRHGLPVRSVLVLLRPSADGPAMSGRHAIGAPDEPPDFTFRYQTMRLWQEPAETLLRGPLGTLPLAPLADLAAAELPEVIRTIEQRLGDEATPTESQALEVVTFTLLGLRYSSELARQLLPGIRNMRDSSTYQQILDEGRAEGQVVGLAIGHLEGRKSALLQVGERRFGLPDARVRAQLEALTDLERIAQLTDRVFEVGSWEQLLQGS